MSEIAPLRDQFDHAERAFVAAAENTGAQAIASHGMMMVLQAQIDALTARVDELEGATREAGAGENTIDHAALEESERDDPAKQWTAEDQTAYEAELPRTLPHQP
jgi:hypothetical protein